VNFGRYKVTGTLGTGAMGDVHLAVDEVLGREVAVKTLKGSAQGFSARLLDERFRQEARAIAQLSHPGIVQVYDIDVAADPPYLVMERVAGPSLKERLADRPLADRELRALGIQIANALAAAHAAGIVHRDVKPANILAAGEGTWKLADFGVAHVPDSELTITGQFVGSPAYAPPEALLRGELGPSGDIYGLGATLYLAIAGRWPRNDGSGALFAPVPPLAQLAPQASPQLAELIDRAVSTEPDARPSATEFASGLARAATPIPTTAVSLPPVEATQFVADAPKPKRSWQKSAFLGATMLVIIIIAITRQSPSPPTSNVRLAEPRPMTKSSIEVARPSLASDKAERDWNKLVDKIQEGKFREARKKLAEFERKHGSSPETRHLAEQLAQVPDARDDD
jgi:serine/threonine-protein kinase